MCRSGTRTLVMPSLDKRTEALVIWKGPYSVFETSSVWFERSMLLVCRSGGHTLVVPSLRSQVHVAGSRALLHVSRSA